MRLDAHEHSNVTLVKEVFIVVEIFSKGMLAVPIVAIHCM
jgi:hypothetical protein